MTQLISGSYEPPHRTHFVIDAGDVSLLFSQGEAVGYAKGEMIACKTGVNRIQQKHLNQWRTFTDQTKQPPRQFYDGLAIVMKIAANHILTESPNLSEEHPQMADELEENIPTRSAEDDDLDALDALEDDDDDLDDDLDLDDDDDDEEDDDNLDDDDDDFDDDDLEDALDDDDLDSNQF